jgi:hypothetical protein
METSCACARCAKPLNYGGGPGVTSTSVPFNHTGVPVAQGRAEFRRRALDIRKGTSGAVTCAITAKRSIGAHDFRFTQRRVETAGQGHGLAGSARPTVSARVGCRRGRAFSVRRNNRRLSLFHTPRSMRAIVSARKCCTGLSEEVCKPGAVRHHALVDDESRSVGRSMPCMTRSMSGDQYAVRLSFRRRGHCEGCRSSRCARFWYEAVALRRHGMIHRSHVRIPRSVATTLGRMACVQHIQDRVAAVGVGSRP